jgi:hypothetical protein
MNKTMEDDGRCPAAPASPLNLFKNTTRRATPKADIVDETQTGGSANETHWDGFPVCVISAQLLGAAVNGSGDEDDVAQI